MLDAGNQVCNRDLSPPAEFCVRLVVPVLHLQVLAALQGAVLGLPQIVEAHLEAVAQQQRDLRLLRGPLPRQHRRLNVDPGSLRVAQLPASEVVRVPDGHYVRYENPLSSQRSPIEA